MLLILLQLQRSRKTRSAANLHGVNHSTTGLWFNTVKAISAVIAHSWLNGSFCFDTWNFHESCYWSQTGRYVLMHKQTAWLRLISVPGRVSVLTTIAEAEPTSRLTTTFCTWNRSIICDDQTKSPAVSSVPTVADGLTLISVFVYELQEDSQQILQWVLNDQPHFICCVRWQRDSILAAVTTIQAQITKFFLTI